MLCKPFIMDKNLQERSEKLDEILGSQLLELAYNHINSRTYHGKDSADEVARVLMESFAREQYGDNPCKIRKFTGDFLLFYQRAKQNPGLMPPSIRS